MAVLRTHATAGLRSEAVYSPCGTWRYRLSRTWDESGSRAALVLLNPSTATEAANDPTVARVERFARDWGHGGFDLMNLFAFRATRPADLIAAAEPVGPETDALLCALAPGRPVICGWGRHGRHAGRGPAVEGILRRAGMSLMALAVNADGSPRHPLYLPAGLVPRPWAGG